MPWSIHRRDGRYCVVKEGESSPVPGGCHDSRADAIKHQRALYANESRMASLYEELDEQDVPEESPLIEPSPTPPAPSELVKVVVGSDNEALTASMMAQMERMSERQARTDEALVAALAAIGSREPVVNVEAPSVSIEPAAVTIEPPAVTVEAPNVTVAPPEVTVSAPTVTVAPEIVLPSSQKTVTFERDPLTGQVAKAEVSEA